MNTQKVLPVVLMVSCAFFTDLMLRTFTINSIIIIIEGVCGEGIRHNARVQQSVPIIGTY